MSAEASAARPARPGWSTEGQARLRARKRAWPSELIGLVPKIRVVRVDLSSQAQVQRTAARRGTAWSSSSACRCTMGPGRRSVQPDHQRTPKAAVPWGGSFCFPLMAPRVTPERDVPASNGQERASLPCGYALRNYFCRASTLFEITFQKKKKKKLLSVCHLPKQVDFLFRPT